MTISAVVLFGSRARGDHGDGSDVDLLFVTGGPQPRHRTVSNLSLSLYPLDTLLNRAAGGDLFVCHLVYEAKPIYDPVGEFTRLRAAFRFRESYDREVQHASDLGWLLGRYGAALPNSGLVNRRIAWCVRTILIARSAEHRHPIFSPKALTVFSEDPSVGSLIKQKTAIDPPGPTVLLGLRGFLEKWGESDPAPTADDPADYRELFERTHNDVARGTLDGLFTSSEYR